MNGLKPQGIRLSNAALFVTVVLSGLLSTALVAAEPAQRDIQLLGAFSQGQLDGWQTREFSGETVYSLIRDQALQATVLQAVSKQSASGLFLKKRIDIEKTPWLHWSWKTDRLYSGLDERSKAGDDFVARLYIVVDGGLLFWNTRALNFVWSGVSAPGASWPNPYTANATMQVVESGPARLGQWCYYRRNIRAALRDLLGRDVRYIDGIAVMTDSDNGGQSATTYYGDIYLSSDGEPG